MKIKEFVESMDGVNQSFIELILNTEIEFIAWTLIAFFFVILICLAGTKMRCTDSGCQKHVPINPDRECAQCVQNMQLSGNLTDLDNLYKTALEKWPHWEEQLSNIYKLKKKRLLYK